MALQRFLIAPLKEGLVNNLKPWLIPDDAYQELKNAYVFRGRLKKRWGTKYIDDNTSQLASRLRINIGTTDAGGNFPATIVAGSLFQVGQQFSIGATIFTVTTAGAAALVSTVGGQTGTFNTGTGSVTFATADALTIVYYYPSTPVMGIATYDSNIINFERMYAFDQQFAYEYNAGLPGFDRLGLAQWDGTDFNFAWARMFANSTPDEEDWMFVVNNKAFPGGVYNAVTSLDGVKFWELNAAVWANFAPLVRGNNAATALRLTGARLGLEFKGRMLFFAPFEARDTTFVPPPAVPPITLGASVQIDNRVRYSWQKSLKGTANEDDSFFEASGKGGYIDAPTSQSIITAQFVKDRLVVYFERSTFELAYTGAPDQPFVWQKLDTSLGAESTFSQIPFDNLVVGVGNNGIHACNGANVQRIDNKIPDEVFSITNLNNAFERVAGIRDYFEEMIYWTFPDSDTATFPRKVLIYDYKNQTWAFFDDSFTAWGYFQQVDGFFWRDWDTPWNESNWPWTRAENIARFRKVVAGNQQGFVLAVTYDKSSNSPSLSITFLAANAVNVINHNLSLGDFIEITDGTGSTNLNNTIVAVGAITGPNTFIIDRVATGVYTGGGVITRISNVEFRTKQFNFFTETGQQTFIPHVDFLVDRTTSGEHMVDYELSSGTRNIVEDSIVTGAILGDNVLQTFPYATIPFEQFQDRLWHRMYFQAVGDTIQFHFHYNNDQMRDATISKIGFVLHGMLIFAAPEGSRLGVT